MCISASGTAPVGPRQAIALYRQNFCATRGYAQGRVGTAHSRGNSTKRFAAVETPRSGSDA